jgi:hypothetical protein
MGDTHIKFMKIVEKKGKREKETREGTPRSPPPPSHPKKVPTVRVNKHKDRRDIRQIFNKGKRGGGKF